MLLNSYELDLDDCANSQKLDELVSSMYSANLVVAYFELLLALAHRSAHSLSHSMCGARFAISNFHTSRGNSFGDCTALSAAAFTRFVKIDLAALGVTF